MESTTVSIVIPAKNEAELLQYCLDRVRDAVKDCGAVGTVIVVDNGSDDRTPEIAKAAGCIVLCAPLARNAAVLRNLGAAIAKGQYLAFVDADCAVAETWLTACLNVIRSGEAELVGTRAAPPRHKRTWTEDACDRVFIQTRPVGAVDWVNSSNMIMTKETFIEIGGFDCTLDSAEDVEFCNRLRSAGYRIHLAAGIETAHMRESKSARELFVRELRRGSSCLRSFLRSRDRAEELPSVALPALVLVLTIADIIALAVSGWLASVGVSMVLTMLPLTIVARKRPRAGCWQRRLSCCVVSYVYIAARTTALVIETVLMVGGFCTRIRECAVGNGNER